MRAPPALPLNGPAALPAALRRAARALAVVAALGLTACETMETPARPATQSIAALYQRPAERALINGLRQYEDGAFERADTSLRSALSQGLQDARDVAVANKYLAFLACAFNRLGECEQSFRAAFAANPAFSLTEVEVGHPVWGPIYRKVLASRPAQPGR